MNSIWQGCRASIFTLGMIVLTIWFSVSGSLLFLLLPRRWVIRYLLGWNASMIAWAAWTCGVRYRLHGAENLPKDRPFVALAKHQSPWETYYLQRYLAPVSVVLKKELLNIPFFGWGLRIANPIAIDRGNPRVALRQLQQQGTARIQEGNSVLIFPEGTRVAPGESGNYARGGANIAVEAGAPVVPIAHNAGVYWPSGQFLKRPGTIEVVIGKPIDPAGKSSREITEQARDWIEQQVANMAQS
jgi:1-acyl-sn-glycerol-3-phosphate acyltransferase